MEDSGKTNPPSSPGHTPVGGTTMATEDTMSRSSLRAGQDQQQEMGLDAGERRKFLRLERSAQLLLLILQQQVPT